MQELKNNSSSHLLKTKWLYFSPPTLQYSSAELKNFKVFFLTTKPASSILIWPKSRLSLYNSKKYKGRILPANITYDPNNTEVQKINKVFIYIASKTWKSYMIAHEAYNLITNPVEKKKNFHPQTGGCYHLTCFRHVC